MREKLLTLLLFLFAATSFQSCLPDSFKKFKKDPPQSQAAPSPEEAEDDDDDDDDDEVDEFFPEKPTYFRYEFDDSIDNQTYILMTGAEYLVNSEFPALVPEFDGALSLISQNVLDDDQLGILNPRFSIVSDPASDTNYQVWGQAEDSCSSTYNGDPVNYESQLPSGLTMQSFSGIISGQPANISASPSGEPLFYCIEVRYDNEDGDYEYLYTAIRAGVYRDLIDQGNFNYTTGDLIVLELDSAPYGMDIFEVGNYIATTSSTTTSPVTAEITFVDKSREIIYIDKSGAPSSINLSPGRTIDTGPGAGLEYSTPKAVIGVSREVYAVGEPIEKVVDHNSNRLDQQNAVKFFIDIETPPSLTFHQDWSDNPVDPSTGGKMEGSINGTLGRTIINVAAINRLHPSWDEAEEYDDIDFSEGSVMSSTFEISVVQPPRDISLTNQYILEVSTIDEIGVGEIITINPDEYEFFSTDNQPFARVIDIIDNGAFPSIVAQMLSGKKFEVGQHIDNKFPYGAQKATIFGMTPNTMILTLNSVAGYSVGDIVAPPGLDPMTDFDQAYGVVNAVNPASNKIYISYTSTSFANTIEIGENIEVLGNGATTRTINNIEAFTKRVTTNSASTVFRGTPFVTNGDGVGTIQASNNEVYNISVQNGFDSFNSGNVDNQNPYSSATLGSIQDTEFDPIFYFNRGEYVDLEINVEQGQDLVFTFTPELPQGLTFDEETLTISGFPTDRFVKSPITIEAANPVGKTTLRYNFQVFDHFGLSISPEAEDYESYILHREGKGNRLSPCRVSREQMLDQFWGGGTPSSPGGPSVPLNMNCYLDAGEVELNKRGVELQVDFPRGMCNQLAHRPYYFTALSVDQTPYQGGTIFKHEGDRDPCSLPTYSADHPTPSEADDVLLAGGAFMTFATDSDDQIGCLYESGGADYSRIPGFDMGQNCDESSYNITPINWNFTEFTCLSDTAEPTPRSNAVSCIRTIGICEDCNGGIDPNAFVCIDGFDEETGVMSADNCVNTQGYCQGCEEWDPVEEEWVSAPCPNGITRAQCSDGTYGPSTTWFFDGAWNNGTCTSGAANGCCSEDGNCNVVRANADGDGQVTDLEPQPDTETGCPQTYNQCLSDSGQWYFTGGHNDPDFVCSDAGPAGTSLFCDVESLTNEAHGFNSNLDLPGYCSASVGETYLHECDGDRMDCLVSPGKQYMVGIDYDELISDGTFIFTTILSDQLEELITYPSPADMNLKENTVISNYYRDLSCSEDDNYRINTQGIREFHMTGNVEPDYFLDGGNPVYTYSCLNSFGDELAQINLYIREWNSQFSTADPLDKAYPETVRGGAVDGINDILHGLNFENHREITSYFQNQAADYFEFTAGGVCSPGSSFRDGNDTFDIFFQENDGELPGEGAFPGVEL